MCDANTKIVLDFIPIWGYKTADKSRLFLIQQIYSNNVSEFFSLEFAFIYKFISYLETTETQKVEHNREIEEICRERDQVNYKKYLITFIL